MTRYNFRNTKTGEIVEKTFSISERPMFLEDGVAPMMSSDEANGAICYGWVGDDSYEAYL